MVKEKLIKSLFNPWQKAVRKNMEFLLEFFNNFGWRSSQVLLVCFFVAYHDHWTSNCGVIQPLPPFSDVVERDVTLHRFYFQEVIWTVGFK